MADRPNWEYKTLVFAPYHVTLGFKIWGPTLGAVKFEDGDQREEWDKEGGYWGFDKALKDLGQEGWELVEIVERRKDNYQVAIFKRSASPNIGS
jgi:hypothetical protein